jgi:hypothetical protein
MNILLSLDEVDLLQLLEANRVEVVDRKLAPEFAHGARSRETVPCGICNCRAMAAWVHPLDGQIARARLATSRRRAATRGRVCRFMLATHVVERYCI